MSYMFPILKRIYYLFRNYLENNNFFEFHSFVFYVKNRLTKEVLLFGWSRDYLYVISKSSATSLPQALLSISVSTD